MARVGLEEELEPEPEPEPEVAPNLEEISESKPEAKESDINKNLIAWFQQLTSYRKENPEMQDGGIDAEEYSLESYGISLNSVNTVHFAIGIRNFFQKEVTHIKIEKVMRQPIIFDGRNMYHDKNLGKLGFEYYGIGRGTIGQI